MTSLPAIRVFGVHINSYHLLSRDNDDYHMATLKLIAYLISCCTGQNIVKKGQKLCGKDVWGWGWGRRGGRKSEEAEGMGGRDKGERRVGGKDKGKGGVGIEGEWRKERGRKKERKEGRGEGKGRPGGKRGGWGR